MKVQLTDSDIERFRGRLNRSANPLRESDERRQYLDKVARLVSNVDTRVELADGCYTQEDDGEFYISITPDKQDQPVTSLPDNTWDLLFQETVLFHELGHVLYTDFDRFHELLDQASPDFGPVFREVFNGVEDGAIETFLSREYRIRDDLIVMNANLTQDLFDNKKSFGPYQAVAFACIDHGFYNSGFWEKLKSEEIMVENREEILALEDQIKDTMARALASANGADRVELAWDLAREIYDATGNKKSRDDGTADKFDGEMDSSSGGQQAQPQPVDPEEHEPADEDDLGGGAGEGDEDEDEDGAGAGGDEDDGDDISEDLKEKYEKEVERQQDENGSGDSSDPAADQLTRMAGGGDLSHREMRIPDWTSSDNSGRANEAERLGQSLERILRAQLQRERKTDQKYGLEDGKVHGPDLPYVTTGRKEIFSREESREEKDYSVQIILDRSGSMSGRCIDSAEDAVASLAHGLQGVGCEVSVISFAGSKLFLELPFGADVGSAHDNLFSNYSGGGTPLGEAMEIAAEQAEEGKNREEFVIVVTDGIPNDEDEYFRQLDRMNCPVYGVYISNSDQTGSHDKYFDAARYSSPGNVGQVCRGICQGMIE